MGRGPCYAELCVAGTPPCSMEIANDVPARRAIRGPSPGDHNDASGRSASQDEFTNSASSRRRKGDGIKGSGRQFDSNSPVASASTGTQAAWAHLSKPSDKRHDLTKSLLCRASLGHQRRSFGRSALNPRPLGPASSLPHAGEQESWVCQAVSC